ncbi:hypothetical protein [Vibrio genomosp. F6]|uniref:Uncharacterized protein n=1 Tax=Vibrio genomosp. F6 str. FF-238 TaxID=1191298 RepID=A0A1E5CY18_9VIBR|nr:hypothetical protein [Vibrio genomosp. F6]OEE75653.1 hypothetical protein A130_17005 [Vibrio genomosp. F6 str. FF-238]
MKISIEKLKAVVGIATDKMATTLIQEIAGSDLAMGNFSYSYDVQIDQQVISLNIQYSSQTVLETHYSYDLLGDSLGSIKISLLDSNGEEPLSLEFNTDFDFESAIEHYS